MKQVHVVPLALLGAQSGVEYCSIAGGEAAAVVEAARHARHLPKWN